jgi:sperm-associated antigen 6
MAGGARSVAAAFEAYQKARGQFVQSVCDLANNPKNLDALQKEGVFALLRPLLLDSVPSIQHNSAQALARLANYNADVAAAVVNGDVLPQLVFSLSEQNKFYKKAAASVVRSVAKHSPQLAQSIVDSGAVDALVTCLEEFDPGVKESAAIALTYVARHNAELAQAVADAGAVSLLVLCLQEPELAVKRAAAAALGEIAKHTPELAQSVLDSGALDRLTGLLGSKDARVKRQVLLCLAQVSKHSSSIAETVVEKNTLPSAMDRLKDEDMAVRKHAASLIRDIAKHSADLSNLVVNIGGPAALIEYLGDVDAHLTKNQQKRGGLGATASLAASLPMNSTLGSTTSGAAATGDEASTGSSAKLPAVMALGYIAAFSEVLAQAVLDAHAVSAVVACVGRSSEERLRAAAAWTLGQLGRHSANHAKIVASADTHPLGVLLAAHNEAGVSEDLRKKSKRAIKAIVENAPADVLPALEALIDDSPAGVQASLVTQFAKVLPNDAEARKAFVTSGTLQKLQLIADKAESGSRLKDSIIAVNAVYPEEIVQYYSPGYSAQLLKKLDGPSK